MGAAPLTTSKDHTWAALGLGGLLLAAGCVTEPVPDLDIQVDAEEYVLADHGGGYSTRVTAAVANRSDASRFLYRWCGSADEPMAWLERVGGDTTSVRIGNVLCTTTGDRAPIEVLPGETYVHELLLWSSQNPETNPPVTMEMRTGRFRVVYTAQTTNDVSSESGPVHPLPREATRSQEFRILPPTVLNPE